MAPIFLPGKSHGQRSLAGYTVHGVAKSQTQLSMHAPANTLWKKKNWNSFWNPLAAQLHICEWDLKQSLDCVEPWDLFVWQITAAEILDPQHPSPCPLYLVLPKRHGTIQNRHPSPHKSPWLLVWGRLDDPHWGSHNILCLPVFTYIVCAMTIFRFIQVEHWLLRAKI